MITFETTLPPNDPEDDPIPVTVTYEMRDLGVMGRPNENVQPVLTEVLHYSGHPPGFLDIRKDLSDDQTEVLERAARRHQREMDSFKEFYLSKS